MHYIETKDNPWEKIAARFDDLYYAESLSINNGYPADIATCQMWNQERATALNAFINRDSRRSFDDGPIAGLRIQEYWHPDVPPRGSEQEITFYIAAASSFSDILDFATLVVLFEWEDDVADSARSTFTLNTPTPIAAEAFIRHWSDCASKVNAPALADTDIDASLAVSDEWNDKCYIARANNNYFAVCWSTTA